MITAIDLKKEKKYLSDYVDLRNKYFKDLLSSPVKIDETLTWLANTAVEIWGLIENKELLGVILIYLEKGNEIAFFVKKPGQGIGTKLLSLADDIARRNKLSKLWAWTKSDNISAIKAFEKNGYQNLGEDIRDYSNEKIKGLKFEKEF